MSRFKVDRSTFSVRTKAAGRKPRPKKGRRAWTQAQREQAARYLGGGSGSNFVLPD